MRHLVLISAMIFALSIFAAAQTTEFTYQGKLADTGTPSATYDFQFKLCSTLAASCDSSPTNEKTGVAVSGGIFTVNLDFGETSFSGADSYLEIAVKRPTETNYTTLAPRQKITSAPYSIKSKFADTATTATQLNGLDSSRFVQYDANGDVGIGTTSSGSKLTVAGVIESTSGGVKFPDESVQTTAGLTAVTTDTTLTGNGTTKSPLGIVSPLNIRDQDNPALQPVQAFGFTSNNNSVSIITVPAGKRLVIESVSASMTIATGQRFLTVSVLTSIAANGSLQNHYFTPIFTGTFSGNDYFTFGESMRFYANPETTVYLSRNTTNSTGSVGVTISGYYVNLP